MRCKNKQGFNKQGLITGCLPNFQIFLFYFKYEIDI